MGRVSSAEVVVSAAADTTTMERFWARVRRPDDTTCWVWVGAISGRGHGRFWVGSGRVVIAHRLAWAAAHPGVEPPGLITHDCDNPLCVNPAHLRAGDASSNGREYRSRLGLPGSPLNDTRGARGRAEAIRQAALDGTSIAAAIRAGASPVDLNQRPLW